MVTYANQKVIHIQKPEYEKNYLQVGNNEWQKAGKILTYAAFKIYLYLAGNKNGFDLALSQKAVEQTLGVSKATYHTAIQELESRGYLSLKKGNVYEFSPDTTITEEGANKIKQEENRLKRAKRSCRQYNVSNVKQECENETVLSTIQECLVDDTDMSVEQDKVVLSASTEINKQIINNIDKEGSEEANASSEKEDINTPYQEHNVENRIEYNIKYDPDDEPYSHDVANKIAYVWCVKQSCVDILDDIKSNIYNNMDGLFGLSIKKKTLLKVLQETYDNSCDI